MRSCLRLQVTVELLVRAFDELVEHPLEVEGHLSADERFAKERRKPVDLRGVFSFQSDSQSNVDRCVPRISRSDEDTACHIIDTAFVRRAIDGERITVCFLA